MAALAVTETAPASSNDEHRPLSGRSTAGMDPRFSEDLQPLEPRGLEFLDMNWNYEEAPAQGVLGIQCCASRPNKEARPNPQSMPIWETANMSWWDFQKRRWHTLWLMKTIKSRLQKIAADTESMPLGQEQNEMWEEIHTLNARELKEHAETAKGLFIKAGQVMSAMAGVLPDIYISEFMSLTDHLPVSTIEEVFRTIRSDLKRPPREIFMSFDPEPIASASIAQVHRARLQDTGEIVAVKVQHEGVDRVFLEDVNTLTAVANQVAYWAPDLDFRKFAQEWQESLPHELDFHEERRALERAGGVLRKAGNGVRVPRVHKKLYAQHVFVMEFIEAVPIMKLAEPKFVQEHGIDKHVVLRTLLDAFGIMAFKDGLFHADPHAGNVRLVVDAKAAGGASPVLFDWGLFRELTDAERFGLAKVFHSLANFDIAGLFEVLQTLGFAMRPEMMTDEFRRELLDKARAVMKDTVNRSTTRQLTLSEMADYKDRIKKARATGDDNASGSYSPIYFLEDWPRCIIFFMRMLQILRGLCVSMDAEGMPILQIFAEHAKEALQEGSTRHLLANRLRMFAGRETRRSRHTAPAPHATAQVKTDATLERRVRKKLDKLVANQSIVGAQVAVVQGGRLICDVAAGTLSTIDARPVQPETRFPLLGAATGISALAVARSLRRLAAQAGNDLGISSPQDALHTQIAQVWPSFGGGNSKVTFANLLSHCAGVQDAYPTNFSPTMLNNIGIMTHHFEHARLQAAQEARYAYLLQAFLMAKLGDCLAGKDNLLHWLGTELGPLGLDIAAPAGRGGEASICRDLPALARVGMNEIQEGRERRRTNREDPPPESASPREAARRTSTTQKPSAQAGPAATHSLLSAVKKDPLVFDPLQANAGNGGMFRAGLALGASARGLATMLSSDMLHRDLSELNAFELGGMDPTAIGWVLTGGACQWTTGGLQVLQLKRKRSGFLPGRRGGYGVVCGFGPCVAHFPDLAPGGVTVAVMVNNVLQGQKVVAELVTEALSGYGYAPAWQSTPVRVMMDAARLARSEEAGSLLRSVGGIQELKKRFQPEKEESSSCCRGRCGRCMCLGAKGTAAEGPDHQSASDSPRNSRGTEERGCFQGCFSCHSLFRRRPRRNG